MTGETGGRKRRLFKTIGGALDEIRSHKVLPVPVHELGRVGVVVEIHRHGSAFAQADQRPRKLVVVHRRGDDPIGRELDQAWRDPNRVVGARRDR